MGTKPRYCLLRQVRQSGRRWRHREARVCDYAVMLVRSSCMGFYGSTSWDPSEGLLFLTPITFDDGLL
jgi:hypothetical protein